MPNCKIPHIEQGPPLSIYFTDKMAKATKQTKKFASSGKLKETIKKRRQYQQIQKKVAGRELRKERKERNGKGRHADDVSDDEEGSDEDDEVNQVGSSAAKKASR